MAFNRPLNVKRFTPEKHQDLKWIQFNTHYQDKLLWYYGGDSRHHIIPETVRIDEYSFPKLSLGSSDRETNAASTSSNNKIDLSGTWDSFCAKARSVKSASAKLRRHIS